VFFLLVPSSKGRASLREVVRAQDGGAEGVFLFFVLEKEKTFKREEMKI